MYYLQVNQQEGLMQLLPRHCWDTTDCYEQNGTITHGAGKVTNMGNYRPLQRGKKMHHKRDCWIAKVNMERTFNNNLCRDQNPLDVL
jgi:hypothetical protein